MPFIASRPVLVPLRNYGTAFESGTKLDRLFKDSEKPSSFVRAASREQAKFSIGKVGETI